MLDIHGVTVTIDAMGCQRAIAAQIVAQGGHYVLSVKDNHPNLHEQIETFFQAATGTAPSASDPARAVEVQQEIDSGGPRVEGGSTPAQAGPQPNQPGV